MCSLGRLGIVCFRHRCFYVNSAIDRPKTMKTRQQARWESGRPLGRPLKKAVHGSFSTGNRKGAVSRFLQFTQVEIGGTSLCCAQAVETSLFQRPVRCLISSGSKGGPSPPWFLALFLFSGSVAGAGFSLTDFSVKGMGSAYAGTTAGADEAATIYWNPAGMTRLEGINLQGGGAYVDFRSRFRDGGSSQTLLANPGPPPAFATVPSCPTAI